MAGERAVRTRREADEATRGEHGRMRESNQRETNRERTSTDIRSRAPRIYEAGFMASIRDEASLHEALDCVVAAQLLAKDEVERNNLKRLHSSIMRTGKDLLVPAAHCSACKAETESVWHDVCNVLEKHLNPELWKLIGEKTRTLFDSITEPPR